MTILSPLSVAAPGTSRVTIDRRFEGPEGIANGGYLAGLVGGRGPARVVLSHPTPIAASLQLRFDGHTATLSDGRRDLVTASPTRVPPAVRWAGSAADLDRLPIPEGLDAHPFPRCFVCGPANAEGLGLTFKRLDGAIGAVFRPTETDPVVSITGALDCASGWASYAPGEAGVLGTIEFAVVADAISSDQLIVIAEPGDHIGRTRTARSSVFSAAGDLVGTASTVWIDIPLPGHRRRHSLPEPNKSN